MVNYNYSLGYLPARLPRIWWSRSGPSVLLRLSCQPRRHSIPRLRPGHYSAHPHSICRPPRQIVSISWVFAAEGTGAIVPRREGLPGGAPRGQAAALPALRLTPHLRDAPTRPGRPDHLRGGAARPREADEDARLLCAPASGDKRFIDRLEAIRSS